MNLKNRWCSYRWEMPANIRDKILNSRAEMTDKYLNNGLNDFESGYLECLNDISKWFNASRKRKQHS